MERRPYAWQWDGPPPKDWQFVAGRHTVVAGSTGIQKPAYTAPVDLDVDPRLSASYE
ncbi:MAG: hypothetical protein OET44_02830 [Gammaproteobacteria bacterium]|nr:hypothetical protein [Gammaproteobacteria bacterium]